MSVCPRQTLPPWTYKQPPRAFAPAPPGWQSWNRTALASSWLRGPSAARVTSALANTDGVPRPSTGSGLGHKRHADGLRGGLRPGARGRLANPRLWGVKISAVGVGY